MDDIQWHGLAGRARGMARQLAERCELKNFDGNVLELAISENDQHLLAKPYQDKLRAALEEELKTKIRIHYSLDGALNDTPAGRSAREKQADLDAAVETVSREPVVRKLMESCDARLISATLKPSNRSTT